MGLLHASTIIGLDKCSHLVTRQQVSVGIESFEESDSSRSFWRMLKDSVFMVIGAFRVSGLDRWSVRVSMLLGGGTLFLFCDCSMDLIIFLISIRAFSCWAVID